MQTHGVVPQDPTAISGSHIALYDRIYHDKDYASETRWLAARLSKAGVQSDSRLLEAGCGTGRFLEQLSLFYDVAGFDLNDQALFIARRRLPGIELWHSDMSDFSVETPYDVVTCLFSSIAYLSCIDSLHKTMRCFYKATRPGGHTVVEPWLTPEQCVSGEAAMRTYDGPDMKLVRCVVTKVHGNISHLEFHWMVVQPLLGIRTFVEKHARMLFTHSQMQHAMRCAGFRVEYDETGPEQHGLWIGYRPN